MTRTPPRGRLQAIFDDTRKGDALERYDIWSDHDDVVQNDADAARYWAAKHGEALQTIQDLRSDLSGARFERDIWWPLAFAAGLLTGWGLTWLI